MALETIKWAFLDQSVVGEEEENQKRLISSIELIFGSLLLSRTLIGSQISVEAILRALLV